jgi:hypothetical protein
MSNTRFSISLPKSLTENKALYIQSTLDDLFWYDRAILDLYERVKSYRSMEKLTGIPFESCFSARKRVLKLLKSTYANRLKGNRVVKRPNSENENKMKLFLAREGKISLYRIPEPRIQKVKREERKPSPQEKSSRAAAKLTKQGEEKYIIIARVGLLQEMKDIAKRRKITIKRAYEEALTSYIRDQWRIEEDLG